MRLNKLTKTLKIGMKHVVSFLEKHPELGVVPKPSLNSKLNEKQVEAVIDYYKKEENRPIISNQEESNSEFEKTEKTIAKLNIKVVGRIDLDSLNQSTRPKKKIKEEKRKEREEKEKLRQKQYHQINDTIFSTIKINPTFLNFEHGYATIKYNDNLYTLNEKLFSKDLGRIKKDEAIFNDNIVELIIDNKNNYFYFKDNFLYEKIITAAKELLDEKRKKRKGNRDEQKELQKGYVDVTTNFMSFTFDDGRAIYNYNNTKFSCLDNRSTKDYNILIKIASENRLCKKSLQQKLRITLNLKSKTFTWNNNFDIHNYLNICWKKYAETVVNRELRVNSSEYNYESEQGQRVDCKIENIEFFDGFYKIWIVKNGVKTNTINPLIIKDINSLACLQIVSKYLTNRLPNDVKIIYTSNKVVRLINAFKLQKYVETLVSTKKVDD